jgi:hypothetical protein
MQCAKCLNENLNDAEFCVHCGERLKARSPMAVEQGAARGSSFRWYVATAVALVCAVPIGWLLATAALLPFYLGLFFFALFGLMLGAVQYRIGSPAAPIAKSAIYTGGILLIVVTWLIAMGFEYDHLYSDGVRLAKERQRVLTPEQLRAIDTDTPALIRGYLASKYPPGGVIGYMEWAARSGQMTVTTTAGGRPILFRLRQGPIGWCLRVVISAALLTFGVMSQIVGLTRAPAVAGGDGDGEGEREGEREGGGESDELKD